MKKNILKQLVIKRSVWIQTALFFMMIFTASNVYAATDWSQGVFSYIEKLWNFFYCFWSQLPNRLLDIFALVVTDIITALLAVLAVIPLPDVLTNFQWPALGGMGPAMAMSGLPQGMALIIAGMTVRFIKGLIPLIRA